MQCNFSQNHLPFYYSSHKSYCLRQPNDYNTQNMELSGVLPGKLYDADAQCRQQYGSVARHCKQFTVRVYNKIVRKWNKMLEIGIW